MEEEDQIKSDDSDWERLSSQPSSSSPSSDDEDGCPEGFADAGRWILVNNSKTRIQEEEEDDEDDDEGDLCSYQEFSESEASMRRALAIYLPAIAIRNRFSLGDIEQQFLPQLPTSALLHLRWASDRWDRLISGTFFARTHALTSPSISGFFFHDSAGRPSFASLDDEFSSLPNASLSFISSEPVVVKASSYGLLCCRGESSNNYYICNPTTAQWAKLPPTTDDHGPSAAAVIVMREPMEYNFDADYFLVCAFEIFQGVYGFETFSSQEWEWKKTNEIVAAEQFLINSGVAASGVAYWRTTMEGIVGFDPVAGTCQEMLCPAAALTAEHWEIGELGRKLCVVTVGPFAAEVRVWENAGWSKGPPQNSVGWVDGPAERAVVPLRAQGEREVSVWDGRKKTVVVTDLEMGTERRLRESEAKPGFCADFLPYVSTLIHVKSISQDLGCSSAHDINSTEGVEPSQD